MKSHNACAMTGDAEAVGTQRSGSGANQTARSTIVAMAIRNFTTRSLA